jgi:hypothetical protein
LIARRVGRFATRKRLAFRLHMEKLPAGSTKGYSIAKAVGRSSK